MVVATGSDPRTPRCAATAVSERRDVNKVCYVATPDRKPEVRLQVGGAKSRRLIGVTRRERACTVAALPLVTVPEVPEICHNSKKYKEVKKHVTHEGGVVNKK